MKNMQSSEKFNRSFILNMMQKLRMRSSNTPFKPSLPSSKACRKRKVIVISIILQKNFYIPKFAPLTINEGLLMQPFICIQIHNRYYFACPQQDVFSDAILAVISAASSSISFEEYLPHSPAYGQPTHLFPFFFSFMMYRRARPTMMIKASDAITVTRFIFLPLSAANAVSACYTALYAALASAAACSLYCSSKWARIFLEIITTTKIITRIAMAPGTNPAAKWPAVTSVPI